MINDKSSLLDLTAQIVVSVVANNKVATDDVPGVVQAVHAALTALGEPEPVAEPMYEGAVPIKKSLADPNRIISMIDGKGYASLKRHLTAHGLTLTQYKERYGLPANYPSVAPGYSERRRALSLQAGLGRKKAEPVTDVKLAAKKRGRKSAVERLRDAKASSPMSQD